MRGRTLTMTKLARDPLYFIRKDTPMFDRDAVESVLFRLAVSSLGYYPERTIEEPGYTLDEDLVWCIEPLAQLPETFERALRERMREVIVDPTAHRRTFTRDLLRLVTE